LHFNKNLKEHHLQRALSAQQVYGTAEALVIPVPEMDIVGERYQKLYGSKADFRPPKQYIHVQRELL
jgi:enhancer of polycomb-like protein